MGKGLCPAGLRYACPVDAAAIHAESWPVQRIGIQQPDPARPKTCTSRASTQRSINTEAFWNKCAPIPWCCRTPISIAANATKAAEYSLTDETYAKLLAQLSERKFDRTSPELRDNILAFYSDLAAPIDTKKNPGDWQNVLTELDQLKSMTPVTAAAQ